MWRSREKNEDSNIEPAQCPVCKAILGKRDKSTIFIAHCEECRATFTWRMSETKPTVMMDKDVKKHRRYCDKDGCYCRS